MKPQSAVAQFPVQQVSDRFILRIVACYALAFILFGYSMSAPMQVWSGLGQILTTRDALVTDYIGVGGIGAAFVNAGLLTLTACAIYHRINAPVSGLAVACLFLLLGFGLFGKNLLNVWPIVAGVYLYSKFRNEPFAAQINVAFLGCALAPVFSEILYSSAIPLPLSLPLAVLTGLLLGFVLPPAAAQLFRAHGGFSLYNIGFAAGVLGVLIVALYKSYGFVPDPVLIWTTHNKASLTLFLGLLFLSMLLVGVCLDRQAWAKLPVLLQSSGQAPTDFIAEVGAGPTFVNMGLCGMIGLAYVLLVGADLNGPTSGGIFTIVGFAAFGKHPRNILPIMAGVFLASIAKPWNASDASIVLAALFGTTLAPIAGQFGWFWGLVAGFLHASAALTVGYAHAGLNLYNNGFAAGMVAAVLVPVILAIQSARAGTER